MQCQRCFTGNNGYFLGQHFFFLYLLGRRIRGPTLGIVLAYGWAAFPFTLFVSNSNSNDSLVAMLITLLGSFDPRAELKPVADAFVVLWPKMAVCVRSLPEL